MIRVLVILSLVLLSLPSFAQDEDEDAFDPFADYSEFVEASTEESDLNFFRYGRMLSVGLGLGVRSFTGSMGSFYDDKIFFGGFFTYYLSLQFAFQLSFTTGSHDLFIGVDGTNDVRASVTFDVISLHGKYFINTQNLTKAVAQFNPYFIGGFSSIIRTTEDQFQAVLAAKDNAVGFDLGAGVEYMFNNKRAFVGLQIMYSLADFSNENQRLFVGPGLTVDTGETLDGDPFFVMGTLGYNF